MDKLNASLPKPKAPILQSRLQPLHQVARRSHDLLFKTIHRHSLIYNACWEDPRIDRELLKLTPQSRVVMLTSAGCNALEYLLDNPAEIHTVDVNPRQNALLELKLALLTYGRHADLFQMFGRGSHMNVSAVYGQISRYLPDFARDFWDTHLDYFAPAGRRSSFFYRGASGTAAWLLSSYLLRVKRALGNGIFALLECNTLREQRTAFAQIEPALWDQFTSWCIQQPWLMSMLGVPRAQIQLMKETDGSVQSYVDRCLRHVLTGIPLRDNYFWRVYLTGSYTPTCCPNYVKAENFERLGELAPRVFAHTSTLSDFLLLHPGQYSHFVLLDHQDWLAQHAADALKREWQLILANSQPGARILLRSASATLDFLPSSVRPRVRFHPELTTPLHQLDRVGTYASVHFGEVIA